MKRIITLLFVALSLLCKAQETGNYSPDWISAIVNDSVKPKYIIDDCLGLRVMPASYWQKLAKINAYWERLSGDPSSHIFTRDELVAMPINEVTDAISLLPGVYQARTGDDLSIFGARYSGTQYIIDGMVMHPR